MSYPQEEKKKIMETICKLCPEVHEYQICGVKLTVNPYCNKYKTSVGGFEPCLECPLSKGYKEREMEKYMSKYVNLEDEHNHSSKNRSQL